MADPDQPEVAEEQAYEVEALLEHRILEGKDYFLIKWVGYDDPDFVPEEDLGDADWLVAQKAELKARTASLIATGQIQPDEEGIDHEFLGTAGLSQQEQQRIISPANATHDGDRRGRSARRNQEDPARASKRRKRAGKEEDEDAGELQPDNKKEKNQNKQAKRDRAKSARSVVEEHDGGPFELQNQKNRKDKSKSKKRAESGTTSSRPRGAVDEVEAASSKRDKKADAGGQQQQKRKRKQEDESSSSDESASESEDESSSSEELPGPGKGLKGGKLGPGGAMGPFAGKAGVFGKGIPPMMASAGIKGGKGFP
ncbi:unnamed protein product, partial [Amoebophrya sp. A120]|eukprot:GSA120T00017132001.1